MKKTTNSCKMCGWVVLISMTAFSCATDSVDSVSISKKISYLDQNNEIVNVELVSELYQPSRSFNSQDELDDYVDDLRELKSITVNKEMWESLSNYCDPFEMSVLDSEDYSVKISDLEIRLDSVGIYEKRNDNDWELTTYFGKTGQVHFDELNYIIENADSLKFLSNYKFLSPGASEIYKQLVNSDTIKNSSSSRTSGYSKEPGETVSIVYAVLTQRNFNGDIGYVTQNKAEGKVFSYKYYSGGIQKSAEAILSVRAWNLEYRIVTSNCLAGTHVYMQDKNSSGIIGSVWKSARTVPWIEAGMPDVYVKVYGKNGKAKENYVSKGLLAFVDNAPRKSGRNVTSRHIFKYRSSDNSTPVEVMNFLWK